ncbi:hypothetical protein AXX17_AT5G28050 [Arabidopsis thaliana]|uniref:Uncharacterized protein n=1 Tax=Arabidopsis thaliana TaxID=3702 RepID=A0A178UGF0_ARATH|nr:hypothetical protein AXX17_AT5G28050 [Arabidopsis thaliana]
MCDGTRCGLCLLVVWPSFFEEMQRFVLSDSTCIPFFVISLMSCRRLFWESLLYPVFCGLA